MAKRHETTILAALAAVLCIVMGYLSHLALNPDGVSYLDLAAAAQRGDWHHFIQGYWSPLYPLIVGAIGMLADWGGSRLVAVTHVLNTAAALAAIFILWRWARREQEPNAEGPKAAIGRAFFAAFLLCGAGLPRIEAVTPDIVLLLIMVWLSYELLVQRGRRWLLVGVLLGLAFLTKTSCWPWLLAALPIRFWAATTPAARRQLLWSSVTCLAIMLAWIVPMSVKYAHPTLGSSGALNWSWYMEANSSRMPDTDRGSNTAFHTVGVGNSRLLEVATFDDAAFWTYEPWGDPTAWATKVLTQTGRSPSPFERVSYWLRLAARVFGLWLGPLIAGVMLPSVLLQHRPRMARELMTTQRDALAVMALGIAGLLQFVAIHAEPRLIAPFGMMLALGAIHWCFASPPGSPGLVRRPWLRGVLSWVGAAAVLAFAAWRLPEASERAKQLDVVTLKLDDIRRRIALVSDGPLPIAVVGPVSPVMEDAFWANVHVALQVAPQYDSLIATLPKAEQREMLLKLFRGKVPLIWRTTADGTIEMLPVPNQ